MSKELRAKLVQAVFRAQLEVPNLSDVLISEAPTGLEEKERWAYHMMRIQIAIWVDQGATCLECGHQYTSVDDFLERNPKQGCSSEPSEPNFVCSTCWLVYAERVGYQG